MVVFILQRHHVLVVVAEAAVLQRIQMVMNIVVRVQPDKEGLALLAEVVEAGQLIKPAVLPAGQMRVVV